MPGKSYSTRAEDAQAASNANIGETQENQLPTRKSGPGEGKQLDEEHRKDPEQPEHFAGSYEAQTGISESSARGLDPRQGLKRTVECSASILPSRGPLRPRPQKRTTMVTGRSRALHTTQAGQLQGQGTDVRKAQDLASHKKPANCQETLQTSRQRLLKKNLRTRRPCQQPGSPSCTVKG